MSKSDHSFVNEDSWKYRAKTYFNNSKQLKNSNSNLSINLPKLNIDQMLKTQNTNAPWLFNVLKKKFHRSKKSKNNRRELVEEFLETPISSDGSSGRWIINEKDIDIRKSSFQNFDQSTDEFLHHYHYDFQSLNNEDTPEDFISLIKSYYTNNQQQIESNRSEEMEINSPMLFPGILEPINEDLHLLSGNSTIQTIFKRAKSASASVRSHRQIVSSSTIKRAKRRSESTKKKKSKYYQEHQLNPQEIELRQALRLIDLDNIGFFSPNQFHKVLKQIGVDSDDIKTIERCLPLDDDGHYSIDNLIKLFLG
jgi:hypothetical protein